MKKKKIEDVDIEAFSEKFNTETDIACAVLGAAILDARLDDLFRNRLSCFKTELLGNMSPIGTFSARIRLACALDWVSGEIQTDLDTIRSIRNDFAHGIDHELTFASSSISDRCKNLKTAEVHLEGYDLAIDRPCNVSESVIHSLKSKFESPRWRFQLTVEFLSQYLDQIKTDTSYASTRFFDEVRELSANTNIRVKATGTVGAT